MRTHTEHAIARWKHTCSDKSAIGERDAEVAAGRSLMSPDINSKSGKGGEREKFISSYAHTYTCIHACIHSCPHTCMPACMHTYSGNVSHSTQLVQHIYQARHMRRVIQHDTTLSAIRIDERWKRPRKKLSLHLLCLSRSPLFRILATLFGQAIRSTCAQRPWLCFQPARR